MSAATISPIRTDEDLKIALHRIEDILDPEPGTAEDDEAEVLTVLIQAYERERWPAKPVDPLFALRFHMDRLGMRPKDLIPYLGAQSLVSEVLSGKRRLTLDMVARLSRGLGVPADDLVGDPT